MKTMIAKAIAVASVGAVSALAIWYTNDVAVELWCSILSACA